MIVSVIITGKITGQPQRIHNFHISRLIEQAHQSLSALVRSQAAEVVQVESIPDDTLSSKVEAVIRWIDRSVIGLEMVSGCIS